MKATVFGGIVFLCCLFAGTGRAEVRLLVREENRAASIQYECTAGEVVRSFALDVVVDRGQITNVSGFFRGESTPAAQGYGIFPAAFRDHIAVGAGTNIDWNVAGYDPLAVVADRPADTRPGLNSSGVTLELGGLWDPIVPGAAPASRGTLCVLQLSQPANVSILPNGSRGGVVPASSDIPISPIYAGGYVDPAFPTITSIGVTNEILTIRYAGGELWSAPTPNAGWAGTGQTNGVYSEAVGTGPGKFFRVRHGQ